MSKDDNINRRNFLKTTGATTMGLGALNPDLRTGLQEIGDIKYDPANEVAYVSGHDIKTKSEQDSPQVTPRYKTIDKDEWERRQTGLNVRDQVAELLSEDFQDNSLSVAFEKIEDSPTDFGVKVYQQRGDLDDANHIDGNLEELLPSNLEGKIPELEKDIKHTDIPIIIEEQNTELASCYFDFSKDYDNVPGGTAIHVPATGQTGTLAAAFSSNDYGNGWVTAGHVVKDFLGSGNNDVYQENGSNDDKFGTSKDGYFDTVDLDYAFVEQTDDEGVSTYITNEDDSFKEYPIGGSISNAELQNNVGNQNYQLQSRGWATCGPSGHITGVNGSGSISSVTTTADADNGDSGGPLFKVSNGTAYIAGIRFKKVDGGNKSKSTTADTVSERLNGHFYGSI